MVLMLPVLLGAAGLVIDVGSWYVAHRQLQAAADAAALAGAGAYGGTSNLAAARSMASSYATTNAGDTSHAFSGAAATDLKADVIVTPSATGGPATVKAALERSAPTYFAKVFGINSATAHASATAEVGSYTSWSWNLTPFALDGIPKYAQSVKIKVGASAQPVPGEFQPVDLPKQPSCALASGASDYRGILGKSLSTCTLRVGDTIQRESGNMVGPTTQGMTDRGAVKGIDWTTKVSAAGDGTYTLVDPNDPNVVVIPIVDRYANTGSGAMHVTGFAWFVITDWTNGGNSSVTGTFIKATLNNQSCYGMPGNWCDLGAPGTTDISAIRLID